jgi:anthranilate synthase component 2
VTLAITLVDADDSFTWNLAQALGAVGARVTVVNTARVALADLLRADAVVLGPGPGAPIEAGIHVPAAAALVSAGVPLLGVCLGQQALGLALGGAVVRVGAKHGYTSPITHDGTGLFEGLPSPVAMMRYHSLALADAGDLRIVGRSADDGVIQAVVHRTAPAWGVQFHPESVGSTPWGQVLLARWVALATRARHRS